MAHTNGKYKRKDILKVWGFQISNQRPRPYRQFQVARFEHHVSGLYLFLQFNSHVQKKTETDAMKKHSKKPYAEMKQMPYCI